MQQIEDEKNKATKEQYERLRALYEGLLKELDDVKKQAKGLKFEIHDLIDKEKMHKILHDIHSNY